MNDHPNAALITRFYTAFAARDAEAMVACYADDVVFGDPVFPDLRGDRARGMWRMLSTQGKDLQVVFDEVSADDAGGQAHWVARYTFSKTGRAVVNDIRAQFTFRDGKIATHRDDFDLWRWTRQALGPAGLLLGWSPLVQAPLRSQAAKALDKFLAKRG